MTINEIVLGKLTYLASPADDSKIALETTQSFVSLQSYLQKEDVDVLDESKYSEIQKMLVAYYTCYNLITVEAMKNISGSNGNAPNPNQLIKKAKADVVETEFQDTSGKNTLLFDAEKLSGEIKQLLCTTARTMGIFLPICNRKFEVALPFKVYH
jgi:hypothetical protein